ncbi:type II secretion system protein [Campylobacter gastrosuis]|uniref:Type II secretion system GspH family protein n=1 Tax=Campylobacter gastrosuis TaxID=2974576 RepID=A0ABT7HT32_9BACT|nr:type II secretion system protein [Campylobacter gastrosuis]MDL0090009.1 type II secretion system GspH family protein [Campylobacter gastrosuis]
MRRGFTVLELIFVIVIIGILAGVGITKINFGRGEAEISNARVQLQSIKSGIMTYYNDKLLSGAPGFPNYLEGNCNNGQDNTNTVFECILPMGGIKVSNKSGWSKTGERTYVIKLSGKTATFTYNKNNGQMTCSGALCSQLE